MPTQKKAAKTYLPPERHAQLEALAASEGQTVSVLLGRLIDLALDGEEAPVQPRRPLSRARREGKVTVRLSADVRQDLEEEARSQGVTASTWAAVLLSARMRNAPQMVAGERRGSPCRLSPASRSGRQRQPDCLCAEPRCPDGRGCRSDKG